MDFNIDNFNEGIKGLMQNVAQQTPDIIQKIALDAAFVIRNRIQEKGLDSQEQELIAYSASYKKSKEKKYGSESVRFTNLTATGEMFRRLEIISQGLQGSEYVVTIGGKTNEAQDRIDWNSERYGDILRVTEKEEENFDETYNDELQRVINESGFGE